MEKKWTIVPVLAMVAGGAYAAKRVFGEPSQSTAPVCEELTPPEVLTFPAPLPQDHLFPCIPHTWYCVSPAGDDSAAERAGMERFAWALFLSINWPGRISTSSNNQREWTALKDLRALNTEELYPRWNSWYTSKELYDLYSGQAPGGGSTPSPDVVAGWYCNDDCLKDTLEGLGFAETGEPVFDQNGTRVQFEVRVDQSWKKTLDGSFGVDGSDYPELSFTHGQCPGRGPKPHEPDAADNDNSGALAIKLAWKVLSEKEMQSGRFLTRKARSTVGCPTERPCDTTVGLVGFHIMQKTNRYPDWIWSTFEHVDNLTPAPGALVASFRDPQCGSECCDNTSLRYEDSGKCKTQIARTRPPSDEVETPEEVNALNDTIRKWLAEKETVLQYYELIGVQYKSVYSPSPLVARTLRNSVIEPYQVKQADSCGESDRKCGPGPSDPPLEDGCWGCHNASKVRDFTFFVESAFCSCDKKHKPLAKCKNFNIVCEPH